MSEFFLGAANNPLLVSPYTQNSQQDTLIPPPTQKFWVDNIGNIFADNNGNKFIFNPS